MEHMARPTIPRSFSPVMKDAAGAFSVPAQVEVIAQLTRAPRLKLTSMDLMQVTGLRLDTVYSCLKTLKELSVVDQISNGSPAAAAEWRLKPKRVVELQEAFFEHLNIEGLTED